MSSLGVDTVIGNVKESDCFTDFADLLRERQAMREVGGGSGGNIDNGDFGEVGGQVLEEGDIKTGIGASVEFHGHGGRSAPEGEEEGERGVVEGGRWEGFIVGASDKKLRMSGVPRIGDRRSIRDQCAACDEIAYQK